MKVGLLGTVSWYKSPVACTTRVICAPRNRAWCRLGNLPPQNGTGGVRGPCWPSHTSAGCSNMSDPGSLWNDRSYFTNSKQVQEIGMSCSLLMIVLRLVFYECNTQSHAVKSKHKAKLQKNKLRNIWWIVIGMPIKRFPTWTRHYLWQIFCF